MTTEADAKNLEAVTDDNDDTVVVELGKPSTSEEQKPSVEPEMMTKEQAEKLANERHSKLDKKIAELTKTAEHLEKAARKAEDKVVQSQRALDEAQRRIDDVERKSYGESPDGLKLFEKQVELRQRIADADKREAEIARREAEVATQITEAQQFKVEKKAAELAVEYGVDASLIVSLSDGTPEKMEKIAQILPKKEGDSRPLKKPDSGKTSKGFGNLTPEQLEKLPMDKYAEYVAERDKRK